MKNWTNTTAHWVKGRSGRAASGGLGGKLLVGRPQVARPRASTRAGRHPAGDDRSDRATRPHRSLTSPPHRPILNHASPQGTRGGGRLRAPARASSPACAPHQSAPPRHASPKAREEGGGGGGPLGLCRVGIKRTWPSRAQKWLRASSRTATSWPKTVDPRRNRAPRRGIPALRASRRRGPRRPLAECTCAS